VARGQRVSDDPGCSRLGTNSWHSKNAELIQLVKAWRTDSFIVELLLRMGIECPQEDYKIEPAEESI